MKTCATCRYWDTRPEQLEYRSGRALYPCNVIIYEVDRGLIAILCDACERPDSDRYMCTAADFGCTLYGEL